MTLATPQDACREQAYNEGEENPERAWILTWFDTWEPNPFYSGPPVPHPESDDYDSEVYGPFLPPLINDEIPY